MKTLVLYTYNNYIWHLPLSCQASNLNLASRSEASTNAKEDTDGKVSTDGGSHSIVKIDDAMIRITAHFNEGIKDLCRERSKEVKSLNAAHNKQVVFWSSPYALYIAFQEHVQQQEL